MLLVEVGFCGGVRYIGGWWEIDRGEEWGSETGEKREGWRLGMEGMDKGGSEKERRNGGRKG